MDHFDGHKAAVAARRELIQRLIDSQQFLEAEVLLWRDWQSSATAVAGPAVAEMAEMLVRAKRFHGAAVCYRRLGRDFADVICRDGKTGKQLAAALPPSGEIDRLLKAETAWPVGFVEVKRKPFCEVMNVEQRADLSCISKSGPFFSGMSIGVLGADRTIRGYDRLGQESWKLTPLRDAESIYGSVPFAIQGHLLLFQEGTTTFAIDPAKLGGGDQRQCALMPVGACGFEI